MVHTTILIVEDDPLYGMIIEQFLLDIDNKIQILTSRDGVEALKITKQKKPDLIITDWDMPRMNGIDFCIKLHENPEFNNIPVIMCTGINTSSENLKTAFESGVVDFIRKPIDKMELLSRVHSMLKLSESYQTIKKQKEKILEEKEKTDKLLLNILPAKIAHDLKSFGTTEPELFKNVTVYLSDIVDFTQKAAKIPPRELIYELNAIFKAFDEIMEIHQCERIKTVGDGYMAVCGMPVPNKEHAENIVKAAIEIIQFLEERNKNNRYKWEIRIGIDTGDVVGGIVGIKKYIYDVFGDTINTASRLEKTSEPMRIHVTENTYNLIKDKFVLIDQPSVEIKGKGKMNMFFVQF
ncbi:MAG TPA: adenylate/guanylate cyclase domain-containing protein [Bacteroidales bacterium]|nr:adenylate/guanylate cyclase domain-containing protein [Bacteroidales bacterium]